MKNYNWWTGNSNLIYLIDAVFTINNNIILCNHSYKLKKQPTNFLEYGPVIVAERFSIVNIYGGEISNNIQETNINKSMKEGVLPEVMEYSYVFDMREEELLYICEIQH